MRNKRSDFFIFFDDGGVLNDNNVRGQQWQELVGKYFTPKFGGNPESWGAANAQIIADFTGKEVPKLIFENKEKSYLEFRDWFIVKWVNDMFDYVGIKRPKRDLYKDIYYGAAQYVDIRTKAAFPGVIETIKMLYNKRYTLCTASGTESIELKYYLEGMGIKQYFKQFYGPDLVNILKIDGTFYRAIFNDLDITPRQSIFVDDKPYYLNIAQKLGANVIQACLTGEFSPQFQYVITEMEIIPRIIEEIIENIS